MITNSLLNNNNNNNNNRSALTILQFTKLYCWSMNELR